MLALQFPETLVSSGRNPNSHELLMAQSLVREVMERQWYTLYVDSLTVKEEKVMINNEQQESQETEQIQLKKTVNCEHTVGLIVKQHIMKLVYILHMTVCSVVFMLLCDVLLLQKDLWWMFARGVISFRRGLMNPETAEDFKSYLRDEVIKGNTGSHKKVVGTKVRSMHSANPLIN